MAIEMVKISHISKAFDDFVVLDDVSLSVNHGENLVVFGKSGTGKSVLLKCMVKLLVPDAGEVFIEGKNVHTISNAELTELRKKHWIPFSKRSFV